MTLYTEPFCCVPAWTSVTSKTRYPEEGTYPVTMPYLAGPIGLDPGGAEQRGVVTFFWTSDKAGEHIVGVQGMHLSSLIVSMAELRLMNRGPYLHMTHEPFAGANTPGGTNALAARLFGAQVGGSKPLLIGDTILIDVQDRTLAGSTAADPSTETWYPCDYFTGFADFYFEANDSNGHPLDASSGVRVTLHNYDLTDQAWLVNSFKPGEPRTAICQLGTWCVVVHNPTSKEITYAMSVTPNVG